MDPTAALVTATLLSSHAAVSPGQELWLGLRLEVAPGWHVYWDNPGDSGMATSVDLSAPGLRVGPIRWPAPALLPAAGGLWNQGYEGEVTLLLPAWVDAADPSGLSIRGEARWLVCRADQCVPGQADLALDLPPGQATPTGALDHAVAALPIPTPLQATSEGLAALLPATGPLTLFSSRAMLDAAHTRALPTSQGTRVEVILRAPPAPGAHLLAVEHGPAPRRAWFLYLPPSE
jgi:thiol:disulfide interchange protein DsbD